MPEHAITFNAYRILTDMQRHHYSYSSARLELKNRETSNLYDTIGQESREALRILRAMHESGEWD